MVLIAIEEINGALYAIFREPTGILHFELIK